MSSRTSNTTKHTPPILGPHNPDLLKIIRDLQLRVSKLESRLNTR